MSVTMDPEPYFQRNYGRRSSDRGVKKAVGEREWVWVTETLGALGWPISSSSSTQLIHDGVQCFQEGFGLSDRLAVDRFPGEMTRGAMALSLKEGGRCWENFRWGEIRDWRSGWIRGRYELLSGCQQVRTDKRKAFSAASWLRMLGANAAVGGSTGSRHLYAEACDPRWTLGLTLGEAFALGIFSGLGVIGTLTRSGEVVFDWDSIVTHIDVGGLCEKGSNRQNRARGPEDPMVWPYHPTTGRAQRGRYLSDWGLAA